jgi:hypothetical protein
MMTIKVYSKDLLAKDKPKIQFPLNFRLQDHVREVGEDPAGGRIYEFIGTDSFGAEWQQRQSFEVNAGRDEEPILYTPLYDVVNDAGLPKNVDVNTIGPGGVVFEEVFEGGEVKFSTITSGEFTVPIRHWATGLEYSDDLVVYNSLWNVALVERQMGVSHNALLNHLHLNPIISYTYAASNQTAANTDGDSIAENYLLTIEDAIEAGVADTTNPRRGPYVLLISTANRFMMEKALQTVPQQGFSVQSSAQSMIRAVIAYDGWTGTRGAKATTYSGVTANKAYLISQQYRGQDFRSFVKTDLQQYGMQEDISRFLTQTVWHSRYGVYANPLRSVEEITLPTTA